MAANTGVRGGGAAGVASCFLVEAVQGTHRLEGLDVLLMLEELLARHTTGGDGARGGGRMSRCVLAAARGARLLRIHNLLLKLSNGEFVNPEQLERVYSRAALIEHALVTGGQEWASPLVLATVDMEEAAKVAAAEGLPEDEDALRASDQLADLLRRQLLREADQAGLPAHERPHKVLVIPEQLSEETGTLTKGLKKIVPGAIEKRYVKLIESARQPPAVYPRERSR